MDRGSKRVRLSLTVGEQVCLAFIEHLKGTASRIGIEIDSRTNEVVAYRKLGCDLQDIQCVPKRPRRCKHRQLQDRSDATRAEVIT